MKFTPTPLLDAWIIEPKVFQDERGFFLESYLEETFAKQGIPNHFVQDNHARSEKVGVLRGLHFQTAPSAQAKLVRVIQGAVYDAIVDLRQGSPTYGQSFGVELTAQNFKMIFVPSGFAHGYCTMTPGSEVVYKVDARYAPPQEGGIIWNDPDLQLAWPTQNPILSDKDQKLPRFRDFSSPFVYEPKTH